MTILSQKRIDEIVQKVTQNFRTFGGGDSSNSATWNPVSAALKDKPAQFAAGVDVQEVVKFVISEVRKSLNK
jgi:hypothetical protein